MSCLLETLEFVLLIPASLSPALAQLGCLLALPEHAGFLEETPTANLGQHPIGLDLLLETLQSVLEGLAFVYYYP